MRILSCLTLASAVLAGVGCGGSESSLPSIDSGNADVVVSKGDAIPSSNSGQPDGDAGDATTPDAYADDAGQPEADAEAAGSDGGDAGCILPKPALYGMPCGCGGVWACDGTCSKPCCALGPATFTAEQSSTLDSCWLR